MKLNLLNGNCATQSHVDFLSPSLDPDKGECRKYAPDFPYYRCTRKSGHTGDCAAHGRNTSGLMTGLVMFARWPQSEGSRVHPTLQILSKLLDHLNVLQIPTSSKEK